MSPSSPPIRIALLFGSKNSASNVTFNSCSSAVQVRPESSERRIVPSVPAAIQAPLVA